MEDQAAPMLVMARRTVVDEEARPQPRKNTNLRAKALLLSPIQASKRGISALMSSPSFHLKKKGLGSIRNRKRMTDSCGGPNNVMQWLEESCPLEIVAKVLAFTGPHTAASLQQTNHFWHRILDEEATWRTLCEELYKWKEGDPTPSSWKSYYRYSPCVPVDYSTVPAALAVACEHDITRTTAEQRHDLRILLRPGKHFLKESLNIQAVARTSISIETMELPRNTFTPAEPEEEAPKPEELTSPAKRALRRATSFRQRLSCRSIRTIEDIVLEDLLIDDLGDEDSPASRREQPPKPVRASLVLRTRRQNEPMIRVRQGVLRLTNIALVHSSVGVDIWNGNSAVQIQPVRSPDDPIANLMRPSAILDRCDVTSRSGRGVVNIDGGHASIKNCYVHDCAATGIYVGGPGSDAIIVQTDVVRNGNGNRNRRGIARGHSGIYLEQGTARVRDCNISRNSLTGISAVSASNAILSLEASDLVANGSVQLEMPPNGSVARRRSWARDNTLAVRGVARSRSGLLEDSEAATSDV